MSGISDAAPLKQPILRYLLIAWLAACILSLIVRWSAISRFELGDPDDYLRLVQVRDWVAGQGWFDVSQHRFNPPAGGNMHWSRIVDLPLGGAIMLLSPLIGVEAAELVALTIVPLLLLGVTIIALGLIVQPMIGWKWAVLTSGLVVMIPSLLHQMAPLRIDHQGWQIAMAALALLALIRLDGRGSGLAAGLVAAIWVQVSAEALPYVAAIGAMLGLRYLLDEAQRPRLTAYLAVLAGASILLFAATRPPALWLVPQCDAISTPFLIPFLIAAALVTLGSRFAGGSMRARTMVLGGAGAVAATYFILLGGNCLAGPFGTLDPLVYDFWYLNVLNGRPIWDQDPMVAAALGTLWTPIIGGYGVWLGWRSAKTAEDAWRWAEIGLMLVPATLVAIMIQRAESVAHLFALPGCGYLLARMLPWVAGLRSAAARVPLTVMALVLPSPAPAMLAALKLDADEQVIARSAATTSGGHQCNSRGFAALAALPPQRLLTSLDIGPIVLASTPHSIMASGYHRNGEAIHGVLSAFLGSPEQAHAYVRRGGVDMIVYCRGFAEVDRYTEIAPGGFMARLERGDAPDWLEPVPSGGKDLRLWRVKREP